MSGNGGAPARIARVLVTGAAGFLGRHLVAQLARQGRMVRAFDLAFDPPLDPLEAPAHPGAVEPRIGSVTNPDDVAAAVQGMDGVIHAAAIAHLWRRDPADFERVNVMGTRRLMEAARAAGLRCAVHVSSCVSLIGGDIRDREVDESVELAPEAMLGPYPRSKRRAELLVGEMAATGWPVAIVQPSTPIGPGDWGMTAPTVMVRDLAAGKLPAYLDCVLNLVDVRAVADGCVRALDHAAPGRRYVLGGENLSFPELAAKIAAITGAPPPRSAVPYAVAYAAAAVSEGVAKITGRAPTAPLTGVRLAGRRASISNARARTELGFAPPPIDAALADAVAWLRGRGAL